MVSFGHGAFMGIGAYTVVMLWNHYGVSPWIGAPVALALAAVAIVIAYPCFRFKIVGHYFALVTLALSEVTRLSSSRCAIRPAARWRDAEPRARRGHDVGDRAMQFSSKLVWLGVVSRVLVDRPVGLAPGRPRHGPARAAGDQRGRGGGGLGRHPRDARQLQVTLVSALMTCTAASSTRSTSSM